MLTIHKYQPLGKEWDKDKILDCCKTNTTDNPTCDDCCYDTWSDEVKQVNKRLKAVQERSAQLQKKLDFLTWRRDKFKTWLTELDSAQQMAQDICRQLELIAEQSNKIWSNSFLAVKAIQVLFCMIRDFFMQLDYLKTRYDLLQKCIEKNDDPSLIKGTGILKYVDEYGVKLDAIIKTRDDIIKAAIDTVRLSNLLRNNISTREWPFQYIPCETNYNPCTPEHRHPPCPRPDSTHVHYGFKTIICEWHRLLNCDEDCIKEDECETPNHNQQVSAERAAGQGANCDDSCDLETFTFPICNDSYKNLIKEKFKKDDRKVKELSEERKEVNKQKESLQACKSSLDAAIKEVNPTDRCK
ncbi:MAG TPA: hypothetical protein VK618_12290 [Flavitalea sp.]|nr:hypothetical protein [Flavitalea sp.]